MVCSSSSWPSARARHPARSAASTARQRERGHGLTSRAPLLHRSGSVTSTGRTWGRPASRVWAQISTCAQTQTKRVETPINWEAAQPLVCRQSAAQHSSSSCLNTREVAGRTQPRPSRETHSFAGSSGWIVAATRWSAALVPHARVRKPRAGAPAPAAGQCTDQQRPAVDASRLPRRATTIAAALSRARAEGASAVGGAQHR
jgi:hypothetical protein